MTEEAYMYGSQLTEAEEKLSQALDMLQKLVTTHGNNLDYKLLVQRFIEDNKPKPMGLSYTMTEFIPEEKLPF